MFLGSDIVEPDGGNCSTTFNPRREFGELDRALLNDTLLSLRYFRGVWVVQELVLAPSIVIPVRGVEYRINREISDEIRAASKNVAWFKMAINSAAVSRMSIFQMLQLTKTCQASDPRDKIYGILGMLERASNGRWSLKPDYSISVMQTYFGVFAHILINPKHTEVLLVSAAEAAPTNFPTWLPNINQPGVFSALIEPDHLDNDPLIGSIMTPLDLQCIYIGKKTLGLTLHLVQVQ